MKRSQLIVVVLLSTIVLCAQNNDINKKLAESQQQLKETMERVNRQRDSMNLVAVRKSSENNAYALVQFQKKQKEQQRKQATIRIAIGAGFLIILIVGLMRKRNKKM